MTPPTRGSRSRASTASATPSSPSPPSTPTTTIPAPSSWARPASAPGTSSARASSSTGASATSSASLARAPPITISASWAPSSRTSSTSPGPLGGYYFDSDSRVTIMLQYYVQRRGPDGSLGQGSLSVLLHESISSQADSIKIGTHYAFASISDTRSLPLGFRRRQARGQPHRDLQPLRLLRLHHAEPQLEVLRLHEPPARRDLQLRRERQRVHDLRNRPVALRQHLELVYSGANSGEPASDPGWPSTSP